jgi:hypothetical protein
MKYSFHLGDPAFGDDLVKSLEELAQGLGLKLLSTAS